MNLNIYFLLQNPLSSLKYGATFILDDLVPFDMILNDQRPIHAGQGGPLFGQDQGSAPASVPLPAATMASAWGKVKQETKYYFRMGGGRPKSVQMFFSISIPITKNMFVKI